MRTNFVFCCIFFYFATLPSIVASTEFKFEEQGLYFINFVLLFSAIIYFLRKPIKFFLAQRYEKIKTEFEKAEEDFNKAKQKIEEYEEKIAHLEDEIKKIKEEFTLQGEREKSAILCDAEFIVNRIKDEFDFRFYQQLKLCKEKIIDEIVENAIKLAEEEMVKERNILIHKKLFNEYLENIKKEQIFM